MFQCRYIWQLNTLDYATESSPFVMCLVLRMYLEILYGNRISYHNVQAYLKNAGIRMSAATSLKLQTNQDGHILFLSGDYLLITFMEY